MPLTTYERVKRMYEHKEADRVPVIDSPWASTIERWHKEGMPEGIPFTTYFDLDKFAAIRADNSPRYPVRVLEQTEEYTIETNAWGTTMKRWKHAGGVPEFLDFTITDRASWQKAKERMQPSPDRIPWERLKNNYKRWRDEGAWIQAHLFFGFDVTHSWVIGTERLLIAMIDDPEWITDILNAQLDLDLTLLDMIWDAGYHFDEIRWPDDMGYKGTQFFSVDMYRELIKPVHRRAAEWAHARNVKVQLHSCGDLRPLIPELIDLGIDMLNPLEVKAGMDPVALKQTYGDRLCFHGGLNAALYADMERLFAEMERVIPVMKKDGGYIAATDHSVPDSVSLEDFRRFVALAKKLGSYE
ncbi:MAG TPA: hypothetical protein GXX29_01520 [Firmicutes bacterium]|nr:hypothetical protein [Bacillota bacterium]